jgi:hypothetical protein
MWSGACCVGSLALWKRGGCAYSRVSLSCLLGVRSDRAAGPGRALHGPRLCTAARQARQPCRPRAAPPRTRGMMQSSAYAARRAGGAGQPVRGDRVLHARAQGRREHARGVVCVRHLADQCVHRARAPLARAPGRAQLRGRWRRVCRHRCARGPPHRPTQLAAQCVRVPFGAFCTRQSTQC